MPVAHRLAVCMPAYNAGKGIHAAIESILSQTYADFDFIITDDGSTDKTVDIISSYTDHRIILFQNKKNLGVVPTRNSMIDYCLDKNYQYMALMDADDIAYPRRLEKQVGILDKNHSLAICGSSMKMERGNTVWVAPKHAASIKAGTVFGNQIPTPSATIRLRYMKQLDLRWEEAYAPCADYHLWYKMLFVHNLPAENTGSIDLVYTHSPDGVSHGRGLIEQEKKDAKVKQEILSYLGIDCDFETAMSFMRVSLYRSDKIEDARPFLMIASQLINNNNKMLVDKEYLLRGLRHRFSVYLSRVPGLLQVLEKDSVEVDFLVNRRGVFQASLENHLRKIKLDYLDKSMPNISWFLTSFYLNIKSFVANLFGNKK